MKKEYVLYGTDEGEVQRFNNIVDAYKGYQEIKRIDKENYIYQSYYFQLEYEEENTIYYCDYKIYRRGNKVFGKRI